MLGSLVVSSQFCHGALVCDGNFENEQGITRLGLQTYLSGVQCIRKVTV